MNKSENAKSGRVEATIDSLQQDMMAGGLSCVAIVDDCMARIGEWDHHGPGLASLLAINPHAREIAEQRDAVLSETGRLAGPLHGIPVVLKDNISTSNMPTTAGSRALESFVPSRDSVVARKLSDAGAIILGKANLHEFALGGTSVSSLGGQTRNPYDLSRTPGGSSGGSAVAVAMNFCTLAMGTDTVNSIRSPASANCLVGLRPTRGLISRAGVIPVSETQDVVGPIARSVADVARVLNVLAGFDPGDPATANSVGKIPANYVDALDHGALQGRRLGLLRCLQGTSDRHLEVNHAIDQAAGVMRQAGAEVVEVDAPLLDADDLIRTLDVQKWEFKASLNRYLSAEPGAPVHSLSEILDKGLFHKASLADFLSEAERVHDYARDPEYLRRLAAIHALRERMLDYMTAQGFDALMYPLQRCLVVPIGSGGQVERNGILAALTGFPALTVPAGFSQPARHAPLGVPIGLDIIARPFDELLLLGVGYAYEQLTRFRLPPALLD